jgi:hypothetical protein
MIALAGVAGARIESAAAAARNEIRMNERRIAGADGPWATVRSLAAFHKPSAA